jgi:hypothetical protein
MPGASLAVWACTLIGLSCDASTPSSVVIQSAYEHEASNGSTLHDKGLKVLEAKCDDGATGRFLCQVTFMSKDDPDERLYFDVVAIVRTDAGWELRSGLCKR